MRRLLQLLGLGVVIFGGDGWAWAQTVAPGPTGGDGANAAMPPLDRGRPVGGPALLQQLELAERQLAAGQAEVALRALLSLDVRAAPEVRWVGPLRLRQAEALRQLGHAVPAALLAKSVRQHPGASEAERTAAQALLGALPESVDLAGVFRPPPSSTVATATATGAPLPPMGGPWAGGPGESTLDVPLAARWHRPGGPWQSGEVLGASGDSLRLRWVVDAGEVELLLPTAQLGRLELTGAPPTDAPGYLRWVAGHPLARWLPFPDADRADIWWAEVDALPVAERPAVRQWLGRWAERADHPGAPLGRALLWELAAALPGHDGWVDPAVPLWPTGPVHELGDTFALAAAARVALAQETPDDDRHALVLALAAWWWAPPEAFPAADRARLRAISASLRIGDARLAALLATWAPPP